MTKTLQSLQFHMKTINSLIITFVEKFCFLEENVFELRKQRKYSVLFFQLLHSESDDLKQFREEHIFYFQKHPNISSPRYLKILSRKHSFSIKPFELFLFLSFFKFFPRKLCQTLPLFICCCKKQTI